MLHVLAAIDLDGGGFILAGVIVVLTGRMVLARYQKAADQRREAEENFVNVHRIDPD